MRAPKAWIAAWLAVVSGSAIAASENLAVSPVKPPEKDVAALVRELGNENYAVREKATKEIWKLGEAALPALNDAAESNEPEQSIRARDLIRKIQLYITPDTDPSVIDLVERYAASSANEKIRLIGQMRGKRAWRQILKLYGAETSAEVRERLQGLMEEIAIRAARERLAQGDAAGAREFLEMAPAGPKSLMALAEFHRSHGSLERELERAKSLKGRNGALWQLALHRAAGNLEAARQAASAAGEPGIAAAMAALAGDPIPWLQEPPAMENTAKIARAYSAAAAKLWRGEPLRKSAIEPLMAGLSSRDRTQRTAALNSLFLLGDLKTAEPAFAEADPLEAFRYYDALERIPEALRALGLDPEQPDYKAWVDERLKRTAEDNIEDQHDVSQLTDELVALAAFLESRGRHEDAWAAYAEPMAALAEKDANVFVDFLAALFGTSGSKKGAPLLAKRAGLAWAGEDENKWDELLVVAIGDDDRTNSWWGWLGELAPGSSRNERFDGMLALFGVGPEPSGLRAKWLARAWHAVEETPADERLPLVERVFELCVKNDDAAHSLKAWDMMPAETRSELFLRESMFHLAGADRWDEVASCFLDLLARVTEAKQEPRAELHAYVAAALHRAGRHEEAAIHDQWTDKLALGRTELAVAIGNAYAYGRDYRRAADWWKRAAIEGDPRSGEWAEALKSHADELLEQRKWTELAGVSEILAAVYASVEYTGGGNPLPLVRQRFQANTARAFAALSSDRAGAVSLLADCHRLLATDGSLADYFFPALREAGLTKEHDAWFRETWSLMEESIQRYPECDNTLNTAAWFASRAVRNLDQAEKYLTKALANSPHQAAYLDTMAEIQFAKGNRAQALKWSDQAVNFAPANSFEHPLLCRQRERFRADPLPK